MGHHALGFEDPSASSPLKPSQSCVPAGQHRVQRVHQRMQEGEELGSYCSLRCRLQDTATCWENAFSVGSPGESCCEAAKWQEALVLLQSLEAIPGLEASATLGMQRASSNRANTKGNNRHLAKPAQQGTAVMTTAWSRHHAVGNGHLILVNGCRNPFISDLAVLRWSARKGRQRGTGINAELRISFNTAMSACEACERWEEADRSGRVMGTGSTMRDSNNCCQVLCVCAPRPHWP